MKGYALPVLISMLLVACAPATRVTQVSPGLYQISKEGGWGFDLEALKREVKGQARQFAEAAGKQCEILDEKVTADPRIDVYPADDDTYTVTFRLVDRAVR